MNSSRARIAALLVALLLFLTGCGAELTSELRITGASGSRTFTVKISNSDLNATNGGAEAIDQSLAAHLPDSLTYEGLKIDDDGAAANFTLEFEDLEQYRAKLTRLLDLSDFQPEPEITTNLDSSGLITTIELNENFTNEDLMGWARAGLVADEVIKDSDTVVAKESTAVTVNGKEYPVSHTGRVSVSRTENNAFSTVDLHLEFTETGDYILHTSYANSWDNVSAPQQEFMHETRQALSSMDGVTVQDVETGEDTELGLKTQVSSWTQMKQALAKVLNEPELALSSSVDEAATDTIDTVTTYAGRGLDASTISTTQTPELTISYPEDWKIYPADAAESDLSFTDGEFSISFRRGMPIETLRSTTEVGMGSILSQEFEITLDPELAAGHDKEIAEKFDPGSLGTMETSQKSSHVSIRFEAKSPEELSQKVSDYLGVKWSLNRSDTEGFFMPTYTVAGDFSGMWEFFDGGVNGTVIREITVPGLHTAEASEDVSVDGSVAQLKPGKDDFSVEVSGPSQASLIFLGILVLIFTVATVLWMLVQARRAGVQTPMSHGYIGEPWRPENGKVVVNSSDTRRL